MLLARWRVRFLLVSPGSEVAVVLQDQQNLHGELESRAEDLVVLAVPRSDLGRTAKVREEVRYDEVKDADLPSPPIGRHVEIGFASGETERGRFVALTDRAIVLEVEKNLTRDCPYVDTSSVRKVGMSTGVKVAIIAGVTATVLALLGYFVIAPATGA